MTQNSAPAGIDYSVPLPAPRLLIGGEWVCAASGEQIDVLNPATGAVIAAQAAGGPSDVDRAVTAARAAFDGGRWTSLAPQARSKILWRVGDMMEARAEDLAILETLDNGMPLKAARIRVLQAAEIFRYFAGWCTRIYGQSTDVTNALGNFHAYTLKEPVGVAALITPWNLPLIMASAKVATALAAGCSFILKPAEETPLTALVLGEILQQAEVPAGVCNIVTGRGEIVGAALVAHRQVDKIAFTGSTAVGRKIVAASGGDLKKVTLELGGKSPVIVYGDADIDAAIAGAARGIFTNSGQMCIAGSRLYVHRSVYDRVLQGMTQEARRLKVGNGLDASSDLGPLISERQLNRVSELLQSGVAEGGELVTGGQRRGGPGYFIEPAVLASRRQDARIWKEEIFGPVITATAFDDDEEVLQAANDTEYGLAAAVWTSNVKRAHRAAKRLCAGTIWLNCQLLTDFALPFGGYKQSGLGREFGWEGVEAYLQTKSVFTQL